MKKPDWTFALKLHRCKPDGMPMSRLAEYLAEFAALLGKDAPIRFGGIVKGSVVMRARADNDAEEPIRSRLFAIAGDNGTKESVGRFDRLDAMMREDGIYGEVIDRVGAIIIPFPGSKASLPVAEEHTVTQESEITGVVTRIGGRDDTVPMTLKDVDGVFYETNIRGRDLARELAHFLFGQPIRVFGPGSWKRDADGTWKLEKFIVRSYEELDNRPLSEILNELRSAPGNGWAEIDDPLQEWRTIRGH